MSLKARERILKLRETEYKLQKLHTQLAESESSRAESMSEFLSHHQELMSMPGSEANSIPFRFGFQAPKRYIDLQQFQKLTIPPKMPGKSITKHKNSDDIGRESERSVDPTAEGLAKYPSLALQTLYNQLDEQTSKMAIAFPKFDRFTLNLAKPTFRKKQPHNSKRYVQPRLSKPSRSPSTNSNKSKHANQTASAQFKGKQDKIKLAHRPSSRQTSTPKVSTPSFVTKSKGLLRPLDALLPRTEALSDEVKSVRSRTSIESFLQSAREVVDKNETNNELREGVAFGLTSSNMLGVILPPDSGVPKKRGPTMWSGKANTSSLDKDGNMTSKDALQLLKRKLPERTVGVRRTAPPPHKRGLIGVEISSFEPECAFFYRDRCGNYNPHLNSSKTGNTKNKDL